MNSAKLRPRLALLALMLLTVALLPATLLGAKKDEKAEPAKDKSLVDEGTFAVYRSGQLVATESFHIRQNPTNSVTSAQIHLDSGQAAGILDQSCELTMLPDGTLQRYEYKQQSPQVRTLTVAPNDQLLVMHTLANGKETEQPFMLTPSAFVLDDFFFSIREVLLWRYIASNCKPRSSGDVCDMAHAVRARFPVIVPSRNTSSEVYLEFKGEDEMPLYGRPERLRHFLMQTEGPEWNLWLNEQNKLVRISIPDLNIEVLRQEK